MSHWYDFGSGSCVGPEPSSASATFHSCLFLVLGALCALNIEMGLKGGKKNFEGGSSGK